MRDSVTPHDPASYVLYRSTKSITLLSNFHWQFSTLHVARRFEPLNLAKK